MPTTVGIPETSNRRNKSNRKHCREDNSSKTIANCKVDSSSRQKEFHGCQRSRDAYNSRHASSKKDTSNRSDGQ